VTEKLKNNIFILPAALLLVYTALRAYKLSFTIDEGFSFIFYVLDTYKNIFSFKHLDPNNHVLNSALMKFFSSWLPLNELSLRLPALLGHIFFLLFSWLLLKDIKNPWFRVGAYLVLNLNPFMLDFFSLARGYALSWGLMAASLYFMKQALETLKKQDFKMIACFLFAALSVLSSFPMVNYYISLLVIFSCIYLYLLFYEREKLRVHKWYIITILTVGLISIPLLAYTITITSKLQQGGFLYFGGISGFWQDSVGSVVDSSLFGADYSGPMGIVLKILLAVVAAGSLVFLIRMLIRDKKPLKEYYFFTVLCSILFLVILGFILQHWLFNTRYVIERAAIFMLVLFLLIFIYLIYYIVPAKFRLVTAMVIVVFPILHFVHSFNISYFYEWKDDACSDAVMRQMENIHSGAKNTGPEPIVFQPNWLVTTSTMFYQYLYHENWMEPIESKKKFDFTEDYFYMPDKYMSTLKNHQVSVIKRYPLSHTLLLKNLEKKRTEMFAGRSLDFSDSLEKNHDPDKNFPLSMIENISCIGIRKDIFSPALIFDISNISGRGPVIIKSSAYVNFPEGKSGELIISIEDRKGKNILWKSLSFDNYLMQQKSWMEVPFKIRLDRLEPEAAALKIFIWNTGIRSFYASKISGEIGIIQ
jgi:hypothetical protein